MPGHVGCCDRRATLSDFRTATSDQTTGQLDGMTTTRQQGGDESSDGAGIGLLVKTFGDLLAALREDARLEASTLAHGGPARSEGDQYG